MSMALSAFGRILFVSSACAVALSVCMGVRGCGCPSSISVFRIETAVFALMGFLAMQRVSCILGHSRLLEWLGVRSCGALLGGAL